MPKSNPGWSSYVAPASIIFEIGAYEGSWCKEIAPIGATIHAFEPSPIIIQRTRKNLDGIDNVHLYNYGLGSRNAMLTLYNDDCDGATFLTHNGKQSRAEMRNIADVIKELSITHIDVCRINIEGGEFDLLTYMLSAGIVPMIRYLMIQWHHVVQNSGDLCAQINTQIGKSHRFVRDMDHAVWSIWQRTTT